MIAKQSGNAVIVKITALPTQMPETVKSLQDCASQCGLPCAVLARGVGVIYFALLPAEHDSTTRVAQCTEQMFSGASKREQQATILWCPRELKHQVNTWGASREDFPLMQRVKKAFDPHGLFAPGRFVGGL
jgi:hypothetical protein